MLGGTSAAIVEAARVDPTYYGLDGQSKMSKHIVYEAVWMVWQLRWWGLTKRY